MTMTKATKNESGIVDVNTAMTRSMRNVNSHDDRHDDVNSNVNSY